MSLDNLRKIHQQLENKTEDEGEIPVSFIMKSPLYNGKVTLNEDNLSYSDSMGQIRIKEKSEKKLLSKIRKYGYEG